jgi:MerR family transcriptional regulator, light-induced transcriptional regulator
MIEQLSHVLSLADTPRFNIKAVVQQTQVNISTLRAWEERYGLPSPNRTKHGHRLYSHRDIAIVKWLKHCTDDGLAIRQAVQMLRDSKILETSQVSEPLAVVPQQIANGWPELRAQLLDALLHVNMRQAHLIVNTVCALYPLDLVIVELFQPILKTVGERWVRGQVCIAEEHLITNFVRQRLLALSQLYASFAHGPRIVVGCVPNEQHELGVLAFSVLMEQRGWEVIYLGQNMAVDGLPEFLSRVTPAVLCVGVSLVENVPGMFEIARVAELFDQQQLVLGYSGRVFAENPDLQRRISGIFLGADLSEAVYKCDSIGEELDHERWLSIASSHYTPHSLNMSTPTFRTM